VSHIQPFVPRRVLCFPTVELDGWQLKRYGILAQERTYDQKVVSSALDSAIERLPTPGKLDDPNGNHGIGFQIVHFAEIAVVSPVFYWMWGSVLANTHQMRAQWDNPREFETGVKEVVACVWEMQIISFESQLWTQTVLSDSGETDEKLSRYLESSLSIAELEV
jgi:hypothetical protein